MHTNNFNMNKYTFFSFNILSVFEDKGGVFIYKKYLYEFVSCKLFSMQISKMYI